MNAYSQPQDPQMQINVMTWLPIAWGIAAAMILSRAGGSVRWLVIVLSICPLLYNANVLSKSRGSDDRAQAALAALDGRFDTARTIFFTPAGKV